MFKIFDCLILLYLLRTISVPLKPSGELDPRLVLNPDRIIPSSNLRHRTNHTYTSGNLDSMRRQELTTSCFLSLRVMTLILWAACWIAQQNIQGNSLTEFMNSCRVFSTEGVVTLNVRQGCIIFVCRFLNSMPKITVFKFKFKFKFKIGLLSDVQNTQYRSISISRVKHFGTAS